MASTHLGSMHIRALPVSRSFLVELLAPELRDGNARDARLALTRSLFNLIAIGSYKRSAFARVRAWVVLQDIRTAEFLSRITSPTILRLFRRFAGPLVRVEICFPILCSNSPDVLNNSPVPPTSDLASSSSLRRGLNEIAGSSISGLLLSFALMVTSIEVTSSIRLWIDCCLAVGLTEEVAKMIGVRPAFFMPSLFRPAFFREDRSPFEPPGKSMRSSNPVGED